MGRLAELFQAFLVAVLLPIGGFQCPDVLAQQHVAFPYNPLGFSLAFRVLHHEVEGLLIDVSEKGVDGALDVMKGQQGRRVRL